MSELEQLAALKHVLRALDETGHTLAGIYVSMAIAAFDQAVEPVVEIEIPPSLLRH